MLKNVSFFCFISIVTALLTACDKAAPGEKISAEKSNASAVMGQSTNNVTASASNVSASATTLPAQSLTPEGKILVDWKIIDNGAIAVKPSEFNYPFALDSRPVKNYMNAYHVDAKTAQHNLTIGMATNEAISKILDQIDTSYVSHELTAGKGSKLIIHTTTKVVPSEHDYVIEDPFAKGLILPIQLIPDGKKSNTGNNPH